MRHNTGLTVQELLEKLSALPEQFKSEPVSVLAYYHIVEVASYRGYNSDLALNYANTWDEDATETPMTVHQLIGELAEIAAGKEIETYKNGPVTLQTDACVWVTVHKECLGFYIKDVVTVSTEHSNYVGLITENIPGAIESAKGFNSAMARAQAFIENHRKEHPSNE